MWIADQWKDYELLDAMGGERLERWGEYVLRRPDPQIIWHGKKNPRSWDMADGIYKRSSRAQLLYRLKMRKMAHSFCMFYD
jgi:23S rRNA (cytosine1962-C5)-methyltransferase